MPKQGQQGPRRDALIRATIEEIGQRGTLDVTVGQIARRAGMSPALAHHYFGSKAAIFLAAMRRILAEYGAEVVRALSSAAPEARLEAIVAANFSDRFSDPATVSAWLNFYVLAQTDPLAGRMLHIYHARLRSNLVCALRGRARDPRAVAETLAALIDGMYLRATLGPETMRGARQQVLRAATALMDAEAEAETAPASARGPRAAPSRTHSAR